MDERTCKLVQKINLLGGQLIDINEWAVVYRIQGKVMVYNTYLDVQLDTPDIQNILIKKHFIITVTDNKRNQGVYVKHKQNNCISRYKRATDIQITDNESEIVLVHSYKLNRVILINEFGKLKILTESSSEIQIPTLSRVKDNNYKLSFISHMLMMNQNGGLYQNDAGHCYILDGNLNIIKSYNI